jgi:glyoxylase-like metal-dependent hydrolase (beta-lactamase superfamily II)
VSGAELEDRKIGNVTVLFGEQNGKYPHGNSVLVRGSEEMVLFDPSLSVIARRETLPPVDRLLLSHCHEDHVAANFLFPEVPWHLHEEDLPGIRSLDAMMAIYGYPEPVASQWRRLVEERFHLTPRPDAVAFRDGDCFDLGRVRVRVLHAPGHTRGHCIFVVEPEELVFLGDIDLSSFGPYYGDAWSDLEAFERTLGSVREVRARWYLSFHHVGLLEGRDAFLERLERFAAVIRDREERLLAFLAQPRSLDEIAAHRFVYSRGSPGPFTEPMERRSMEQHLERLLRRGEAREVAPGRFLAKSG